MNIQSISNNKLTLLRKLNQKKYRQQEQLFLVEGSRAVEQIIENGRLTLDELFFDEAQHYLEQKNWEKLIQRYPASIIDEKTFAEISDTDNPQGVMALCKMPQEIDLKKMAGVEGIIIALDAIQDPGNAGTIIRTGSWFGVQGLLSGKGTVDLFHPKVVRSTAGATGSVPHANVEMIEALSFFEGEGWEVVLLDAGVDSVSLKDINRNNKTIVVIGNEGNGIDDSLFNPKRQKICISSPHEGGHVESLNAAIATSIVLYALT